MSSMIRSYVFLRRSIGMIGMALPVLLIVGNLLWPPPEVLASISGYFYSPLRGVFVGSMCAVGVFLLSYRGIGLVDDLISNVAAVAAVGLALFPTTPSGAIRSPDPDAAARRDRARRLRGHVLRDAGAVLPRPVPQTGRSDDSRRSAPPRPRHRLLRGGRHDPAVPAARGGHRPAAPYRAGAPAAGPGNRRDLLVRGLLVRQGDGTDARGPRSRSSAHSWFRTPRRSARAHVRASSSVTGTVDSHAGS